MAELLTFDNLVALLTLSALEIVLGIDNIVFLSIVTGKLPPEQRPRAQRIGLALALGMRVLLLLAIGWVMKLTDPLFTVVERDFAGKDLILLLGGGFLIAKATWEIHDKLEGAAHARKGRSATTMGAALVQIVLLDAIFSLDSVITAVGMAREIAVMIAAVTIAIGVMMVFAGSVSRFVDRHPTIKMLALAFLILIGVMLTAEALGQHIERGYIYFAMAFSLAVEVLNIRVRAKAEPVQLRHTSVGEPEA
jgi:predicted tellurium resistance membrane protein TerC